MKTFTELVTFKNFDYVDEQVIKHYVIHRGFNETLNYYTFESLGIFKGCKNIVNYIIKNYNNDKELHINVNDINGLPNKFFDKINVYFASNDIEGINGSYTAGYDDDEENEKYQNNRWNDNLKIFNFIDIYIYNYNNIDESALAEILTHELMHAWDDWMLRKNGYSLRDKTLIKNKSNEEILDTVSDTIKLLGIRAVLDDDHEELNNIKENAKYIEHLKLLFYYLDKFEINSFIAQMNGSLYNKKFNDIKQCLEYIKEKSPAYYNHKIIYEFLHNERCVNILKSIGVPNKLINKYKSISDKTIKKIVNHMYLICADHIANTKVNHTDDLINITEKLKPIYLR